MFLGPPFRTSSRYVQPFFCRARVRYKQTDWLARTAIGVTSYIQQVLCAALACARTESDDRHYYFTAPTRTEFACLSPTISVVFRMCDFELAFMHYNEASQSGRMIDSNRRCIYVCESDKIISRLSHNSSAVAVVAYCTSLD